MDMKVTMCRCQLALLILAMAWQTRAETTTNTLSETMPVYALAMNARVINDSTCQRHLTAFAEGVDERKLWSLKMLDSSGEPNPGFINGNNYWLGISSQCLDANNHQRIEISKETLANYLKTINLEEEFPPFIVNYFVAHFRHNATMQMHLQLYNEDVVTLGLCLPASCSTTEIGLILNHMFRERSLLVNKLYGSDFKLIQVKDMRNDSRWINGRYIFFGVVLMALAGLVIIGTIYDKMVHQKRQKTKKNLENLENNNTTTVSNGGGGLKYTFECTEANVRKTYFPKSVGKILLSFSIRTNTKIIFSTKLGGDSVPIIHGLRFLGMTWIIMIHTIYYMYDYVDNKLWSVRMSEGIAVQVISNSTLSVDTFFFLSGFLLSYMYLKSRKGKEESKPVNYGRKVGEFLVSVLRRFIRLTPSYMMVMGIVELNSAYYNQTSQFYMSERPHDICAKYWWRNILYINNLFDRESMCMSWSWYLSNDMQFFIIGTFLLILSSVYFYLSVSIVLLLLVSSIVTTGILSYVNNYVPTLDEQYKMLEILYDPPWTRIGPYLIGMMTAYILIRLNNKLPLRKAAIVSLWCIGSCLNVLVLFGIFERYISVLSAAFYVALSRTVWAIGIAWITIACCTNHGGVITRILSFKAWIPLSRLTYCAYLLNPFMINSLYLYSESFVHLDFLQNGTLFLGNLVSTYCCAYILSLLLETPNVLLMRSIVNRNRKK